MFTSFPTPNRKQRKQIFHFILTLSLIIFFLLLVRLESIQKPITIEDDEDTQDASTDSKIVEESEQTPQDDSTGLCGNLTGIAEMVKKGEVWGVGIGWECGRMPRFVHWVDSGEVSTVSKGFS
ncbi:hypothetical protein HDU97_003219 [Phlyctochytrium planicorne]|nr:hypothetical protein HDU97_003219 [Phlyctochytrium planicorne]